MASSAEAYDPEDRYRIKLPLDPIPKDTERAMVELTIKAAREFGKTTTGDFYGNFPAAIDILSSLAMKADESAGKLVELHRRHGEQFTRVFSTVVEAAGEVIGRGTVPANSMLSMILGQSPQETPNQPARPMIELPEGTRWEDITIEVVGNDAAKILVGGQNFAASAFEMGFWDRRKNLPNRVWDLLVDFAEARGTLCISSKERSREWKRWDFQRLRRTLQTCFGLTDDPLLPYDPVTGYKTCFKILYDRTVKL